jgi:hypothetical protein
MNQTMGTIPTRMAMPATNLALYCLPVEEREHDGEEVADRREQEEARIAFRQLVMACHRETHEETDVHAGVVPEEGALATQVGRREALRQHHVDAGDVEAAAREEQREAKVHRIDGADRHRAATQYLQHHAAHEEVAIAEEAAAEVAAEQVQAVIEGAEYAHDRGRFLRREMQVTGRVQDQCRVEDREAERGEDLDEEQRRSAFGNRLQPASEVWQCALRNDSRVPLQHERQEPPAAPLVLGPAGVTRQARFLHDHVGREQRDPDPAEHDPRPPVPDQQGERSVRNGARRR